MKITLVYFKNRDRKIFVKIDCIYVEVKCQLDATDDFYCRIYCLLNMFRAPLCPSPGAQDYYTDGRCLWYLVLWFSSCRYVVELRVMCPVCRLQPDDGHNGARNMLSKQ